MDGLHPGFGLEGHVHPVRGVHAAGAEHRFIVDAVGPEIVLNVFVQLKGGDGLVGRQDLLTGYAVDGQRKTVLGDGDAGVNIVIGRIRVGPPGYGGVRVPQGGGHSGRQTVKLQHGDLIPDGGAGLLIGLLCHCILARAVQPGRMALPQAGHQVVQVLPGLISGQNVLQGKGGLVGLHRPPVRVDIQRGTDPQQGRCRQNKDQHNKNGDDNAPFSLFSSGFTCCHSAPPLP